MRSLPADLVVGNLSVLLGVNFSKAIVHKVLKTNRFLPDETPAWQSSSAKQIHCSANAGRRGALDEELAGHCEVVMGLQKELAECKESMAAKQGKNVCPACGISNPKDAVFCMYCGTELPGEEEEKEEEWFTQGPVEETEDQEEKEGEEPETEVEEETEEPQEETKEETAPEQDAEQEVWDVCAQKEDGDEE